MWNEVDQHVANFNHDEDKRRLEIEVQQLRLELAELTAQLWELRRRACDNK